MRIRNAGGLPEVSTDVVTESSLNEYVAKETLLVVDGHSLAFRAFYAVAADNFSTRSGQATNAIWGFVTMLSQVIEKKHPDKLAIAFDVKGGTFRNKLLPQYKATRDATPEELLTQLPIIQKMLDALGVTYIVKTGYEGDDIIGTLATMGSEAGYKTLVLSGDRDAFQLINDNITVLYPGHHFKDLKEMDAEAVEEKYHVTPSQYPDLAALRGETSDNIPGVPGVGDGYAAKWLQQFGNLQGVLDHANEISGKKGESLRENIDQVLLNRKVNALVCDLDLGVSVNELDYGNVHADELGKLLTQLEFGDAKKRKILKTFSKGNKLDIDSSIRIMESACNDANSENISENIDSNLCDDMNRFQEIVDSISVVRIKSKEDVEQWSKHLSDTIGSYISEIEKNSGKKSLEEENSNSTIFINSDLTCYKPLKDRKEIILYAQTRLGGDSPSLRANSIVMLAGNKAAIVNASDLKNSSEIISQLRALIQKYIPITIVYDYKKTLGLLNSLALYCTKEYDDSIKSDINPLIDTRLAAYLVEPDFTAESIESLAEHFLDIRLEGSQDLANTAEQGELDILSYDNDESQNSDDDISLQKEKQLLQTAMLILFLSRYFAPKLDARKQTGLMVNLEMPVSRVLRKMEDVGAAVDMRRLLDMRNKFVADSEFAQNLAWDIAGDRVNLQSPKQLRKTIFEDMGLKPTRRTKNGSYTTNAEALQAMYAKLDPEEKPSQFLGALLKYRETNKLKQIVQSLIDATNLHDTRIHTTFEQTVASTGRLSSSDPNLQNIPNRNAIGREIRAAFVPGEGYESLMSCDYSQVELRIMAHASSDESLIKAFCSGVDFHKYVASLVYNIPMEEVSADQRSHVKAMSYGLAYGLSTYGLAKQLGITPAEAEVLKNKYFSTFGNVHDYLESLVDKARKLGYTETMFGRRRYFPQLSSANRVAREAAERGALNAPIQGTAADIMKIAMIRVDENLKKANVASRVILQIHDELVLEIAQGEEQQVESIVREAMEHAVELKVPLNVSTGVGADWQLAAH